MKKINIAFLCIILASFAIAFYIYPQMPDLMASHWDINGEVNGYMPKFWGIFLMPLLSLGFFALFLALPRIDPLKANIAKFRKYFDVFIFVLLMFLLYIYLLTIMWTFGFRFDMIQFLMPALSILFYYCGVLIEHSERNWFIGIRTPWTMSSDLVWKKTHKLGGKLFKAVAIISLIGIIVPQYAIWLFVVPIIAVTIYITYYSYSEYQKEMKNKNVQKMK